MNRLKIVILILFSISIKLNAQDVRLCVGSSYNFGVPPVLLSKYQWTVSDSSIATITSSDTTEQITIDLNNTGLFQLIVKEENLFSCIGYDSILVEILPLPTPNIFSTGSNNFCHGDSVLIQVDSIYSSYLWSDNSSLSYFYADTTASYFVTVTDTNGCSNNSDTISINSYISPIVDFSVDGVCLGIPTHYINQSVIPIDQTPSNIWYLGNGDINYGDTVSYTYNQIGTYTVSLSIQTEIGCKDSLTKMVSIIGNPKADFKHSPLSISTLNPQISFVNNSLNASQLLWDFGDSTFSVDSDPYHTFDDPGIYNVMLIVNDINQCTDSISKNIIMYYDFILHIPNAFTPNNDGDNDTFGPNGFRMEKYKSYEFSIYNKWGERIFETNDINQFWNGADFPAEVYSWIIVITDELGKLRKRNGLVTLIR